MIYHYTMGRHLPSILAHGLRPTDLFISPDEEPILWFSTNDRWENTVFCFFAPTLQEAHRNSSQDGGLARIVCHDDVAPYRWKELKEIARIPSKIAAELYKAAIRVRARPGEWRGTFEVVSPDEFVAVEIYDGDAWVPLPERLDCAA